MTDGLSHRVVLYCVDWDGAGRSQYIVIRDGNDTESLSSCLLTNFSGGVYSAWDFRGHVIVQVWSAAAGHSTVLSGLFFDPTTMSNRAYLANNCLTPAPPSYCPAEGNIFADPGYVNPNMGDYRFGPQFSVHRRRADNARDERGHRPGRPAAHLRGGSRRGRV